VILYRLKFYDNYHKDYRIANEGSLYELLMRWGFWMDTTKEWYIHKIDGDRKHLIGRSAKE
jgi:hypothetical protein